MIFSDRSLVEMATYLPQTRDGLLAIHGVGAVKCQRYGPVFLEIIKSYCREHRIEESFRDAHRVRRTGSAEPSAAPGHVHVGNVFNSGRSIREIMEIFNINQTRVIDYLHEYVEAGFDLRCDEIFGLSTLPLNQKKVVLKAFEKCGSKDLEPAYDALNGAVSYDDLKILRLYFLAKNYAGRDN